MLIAMEAQSPVPLPPPDSAETLVDEIPNQQSGSPNSDYFSPRSDDGSPELYDSPLLVEDATDGKDSEVEVGDGILNSSPRIAFSSNLKCDEVSMKPLESHSPLPLNYNDSAGILPNPFLPAGLMMSYRPVIISGAGIANLGNTCFLNSVLQCFLHTVPLLHGILANNHSVYSHCTNGEFCLMCYLRYLFEHSLSSASGIVYPWELFNNLSYFSSGFQKFQQEDAHEFLQCFLDRLESCDAKQRECMSLQRGNIVKQVFGGCLVSKLKCCSCGHCSDTYEPSIDLSLEIEDADNLLTALQSFTKVEKLEDPETKFTCENCKEQVSVEKQLSFDQTPLVAAFHLKRFKTDGCFIQKIDKHVSFPLELDLFPFTDMDQKKKGDLNYVLYAVVVHIGLTSTSGHYYCFIRLSANVWCKFDDSRVILVDEDYVLSQEAYILFYAREMIPSFSSFIESNKLSLYGSIWNTSPKSVLDTTALASPSLQEKISCDSKEDSDDIATEHRVGKIEIQYSRSMCSNIDSNESKDNSVSMVPVAHDSLDASLPEAKEEVTPLNQSRDASALGNLQDVIRLPMRSPSPEIYREDPPDAGFSIHREHLKLKERQSCKRRLEKDMDDMEKRHACTYIKKNVSGPRAQQLMSALNDSKAEASASRKKGRRSGLSDSSRRPSRMVQASDMHVH